MNRESSIVAGLDLGTTKICAVIAEVRRDNPVRILGFASCPSDGLRRGAVIDVDKTVKSVESAVKQAALVAGMEIREVYIGIAGDHVNSLNSSGVVAVDAEDGRIDLEDRDRVLQAASAIKIPIDREILHVIPQEYVIDGRRDISDPVGMLGVRLEAHVHVVTGAVSSAQNICRSILRAGLTVRDISLEPLASSAAVLEPDEKELGVCLVDIGGGTTDIAVFARGGIQFTGVIGLGGQNVTNDVAIGLRTSWPIAEELKCKNASVDTMTVCDNEKIEIPRIADRPSQFVSRQMLTEIVEARMEEIFILVREKIGDRSRGLGSGIVLTGGGALMEGIVELGEKIFGIPVRLGVPQQMVGMTDGVDSPSYATAVGLVRLAGQQADLADSSERKINFDDARFDAVFGRMKEWFQTWV